jgi:hypothetical protein
MANTDKRGIELLHDPSLNKSTAFTEAEKQALGIVGLVPDVTETEDLQLSRVMMQLGHKTTDLDRYIYLVNLLDHNEVLFRLNSAARLSSSSCGMESEAGIARIGLSDRADGNGGR